MAYNFLIVKTLKQVSNVQYNAFLNILNSIGYDDTEDIIPDSASDTTQLATTNPARIRMLLESGIYEMYEWIGITPDEYVRIFFDLDCNSVDMRLRLPEALRSLSLKDIRCSIINELAQLVYDTTVVLSLNYTYRQELKKCNDLDSRFLYTTACYGECDKKFSLHVIFPRLAIRYSALPEFVKKLKALAARYWWKDMIDLNPYTKTKTSLRTIYSYKKTEDGCYERKLVPMDPKYKSCDIFVRLPITEATAFLQSESPTCKKFNNVLENLIAKFSPNQIANLDEVTKKMQDLRVGYSITIKVNYLAPCSICNKQTHKCNHYITLRTGKLIVSKYGTTKCTTEIPYSKEVEGGSGYSPTYQFALDMIAEDRFRKDMLGNIWYKNEKKLWVPSDSNVIRSILAERSFVDTLSQQNIALVTDVKERGNIVAQITDILKRQSFPKLPPHIIQLEDALYNVITRETNNDQYFTSETYLPMSIKNLDPLPTDHVFRDRLLRALEETIPVADTINREFFERICAMSILGGYKQGLIFWFGNSNAGKTTLITLIRNMLGTGESNYSSNPTIKLITGKEEPIRKDLFMLNNKRMAFVDDPSAKVIFDEQKIKMITERVVTADRKCVNYITFVNECLTIVDTNYHPVINSVHHSLVGKRVFCLEFKNFFDDGTSHPYNVKGKTYKGDKEFVHQVQNGVFNKVFFQFCVECVHKYYVDDDKKLLPLNFGITNNKPIMSELLAERIELFKKNYPQLFVHDTFERFFAEGSKPIESRTNAYSLFEKFFRPFFRWNVVNLDYIESLMREKGIFYSNETEGYSSLNDLEQIDLIMEVTSDPFAMSDCSDAEVKPKIRRIKKTIL